LQTTTYSGACSVAWSVKGRSVSKATGAIVLRVVGLVGSNLWWAYLLLEVSVSYTDQGDSLRRNPEAWRQSLAVIKAATVPNASQESVLSAAARFAGLPPIWESRLKKRVIQTMV